MEILVIFLSMACAVLVIGMIYMQKEIDRQKFRAEEWKCRYLTEMEEEEKKKNDLIRDCASLENRIKKTSKEVEEYRAKYNEILKKNQELLLKTEQALKAEESIPVVEKEEKPKAKVTATRKPRKKKGENE
jgi:regulator of replication initiation timing